MMLSVFLSNHDVLLQKIISLTLVVILMITMQDAELLQLFIILGLPHFGLAYLYKFYAHKIYRAFILKWIFLLIVFFGAYILYPWDELLVVSAAIIFMTHFLLDEKYIFGEEHSRLFYLEIAPLLILYGGRVTAGIFLVDIVTPILILMTVFYAVYLYALLKKKITHTKTSYYFLFGTFFLFFIFFFNIQPTFIQLLAPIILYHVFNWYIFYFFRLTGERRTKYIRDVFLANFIIIGLFVLYTKFDTKSANALHYLFLPEFYFLWAAQHIILSYRKADFVAIFRSK